MTHKVTIRYSDGEIRVTPVEDGQTVLEAAEANGVPVVSECEAGVCGTCVARCTQGAYTLAHSIGLNQPEKDLGRILTCQTTVQSDCVVELDYPLANNSARIVVGDVVVSKVEQLSPETALLTIDASGLSERIDFRPGQFAQLQVPGAGCWRSYSFAHAPRADGQLEFLVRLLPSGAMSDYIRDRAKPGDRISIRAAKGSFYLRDVTRPVVLMAGGTGLSAILSIAEQLVEEGCRHPIRLNYGVTREADLVFRDRLEALEKRCPHFTWEAVVREPSKAWTGRTGLVTDLLGDTDLNGGDLDVYLCGPAPMVDATRAWLRKHGVHQATLYYEKFVASGLQSAAPVANIHSESFDIRSLRQHGRGTAVVIGGAIAGMPAAKMLSETFDKVIMVEQDQDHRPKEGRPGAAQGWHLHHLLIAGQKELEAIFPGIIADMVKAGAFKVDMGESYRLYLGGSWKKPVKSGVEIVCAGRPLLEWCIRRRLDDEPKVEYRYETKLKDLVYDRSANEVVGVVVEHNGVEEIIPAEFVVDASGKNTPIPAILSRIGAGTPRLEEDQLNCFYSTMMHRVPPGRAWSDKVMSICYAYRPQQEHYSAQYFLDSSRTVLCTTLVGYNCYSPPRNADEFREFARKMPSQAVGRELDGLEPCSPVYNFRYPTMQRYHYEEMDNLPASLVSVGDSYCSADPVSGAGMTKALLELRQLRLLLASKRPRDHEFVRQYYRNMCNIADLVWFVIREQNLRYPWIKDVKEKRAFYADVQNWYIDRLFEAMHEDTDLYKKYLNVSHYVAPPTELFKPSVLAKVIGKWMWTKMTFRQTLIERNFGDGRMGDAEAAMP